MWLCKLHYEGSHGQNVISTKTLLTGGEVFHSAVLYQKHLLCSHSPPCLHLVKHPTLMLQEKSSVVFLNLKLRAVSYVLEHDMYLKTADIQVQRVATISKSKRREAEHFFYKWISLNKQKSDIHEHRKRTTATQKLNMKSTIIKQITQSSKRKLARSIYPLEQSLEK